MIIRSMTKRKGFVLYESVLMLLVTIMTLGILQQSLQILKSVQRTTFREQIRWHITQEKLQSLVSASTIARWDDGKIILKNKFIKDTKIIERYRSSTLQIRTAAKGGREPIMTNLNKIEIEKIRNLVIITTENKAGQISKMCLVSDD